MFFRPPKLIIPQEGPTGPDFQESTPSIRVIINPCLTFHSFSGKIRQEFGVSHIQSAGFFP